MNERIKELFNQAGGQGAIHPLKYNGTLDVEKFAELLIKECAEVARQHNLESAERSYMVHSAIKEHFGIK